VAGLDRDDLIAKCSSLSPREKAVLRGLAEYQQPKEIARELNLSVNTVRGYINDARQKLGVKSQRDAARLFVEYDRLRSPHQNEGDQFLRVAIPAVDEPTSDRGFETTSQFDLDGGTGNAQGIDAELKTASAPAFSVLPEGQAPAQGDPLNHAGYRSDEAPGAAGYRSSSVHHRLGQLSPARWMGLSLAMALAVIAAFGIGAVSLLGVFEVLEQMGGPHH